MEKLPQRLEKDPILEAIFEIRFKSEVPAVSELLPGLLYPTLKEIVGTPERLLPMDIPAEFLESNPQLKYQPRIRMRGDQFAILIGDRSTIISCPRPYVGWEEFKKTILTFLYSLKNTNLVSSVERFSVKYVNLLPGSNLEEQFALIKYTAVLGKYELTQFISSATVEIIEDGLNNLVEIKSNATVHTGDGSSHHGMLLAVDTICLTPTDFWEQLETNIEKVHLKEKRIFFNILTDEAIRKFEAIWE